MKKAISQLLSGNMLSKVLGLAREVLMAKFFGRTYGADSGSKMCYG